MKIKHLKISALIFVLLFVGTAAGAELSKSGEGRYRSARSADIQILKVGENRLQINYDETGVVVDVPANSPFVDASFNTMGTIHVVDGELTYNGAAVWTRPNGDEIYGVFKGEGVLGKSSTGSLEIVGGTGQCAGITGGIELKSGPYVKATKKGTAQGTTIGDLKWSIP